MPSRATPITLALRDDLPWLLRAARGDLAPAEPGSPGTRAVLEALRQRGALFRPDLTTLTGLPPDEIDAGIVGRRGARADHRRRLPRDPVAAAAAARGAAPSQPRGLRRGLRGTAGGSAGRWSLLPPPATDGDQDELAEAVAEQLAARWGVVFRDLVVRENLAVSWRELLWAFRRMEARGTIRGGRFVTGFSGEQFAHPDAVDLLRSVRKQPRTGEPVQISAADPLNLTGIVLPGPRIPAIAAHTVTYIDGAVAGTGRRRRRRDGRPRASGAAIARLRPASRPDPARPAAPHDPGHAGRAATRCRRPTGRRIVGGRCYDTNDCSREMA